MNQRKYSERELIARIVQLAPPPGKSVLQSIGDDCAIVRMADAPLLISTDALIEGIHFIRQYHPPKLLGRKTASVNLSDIAAMGGIPSLALLSLAMPTDVSASWIDEFIKGFSEVLQEHQVSLIGGDTVKSGKDLMFSVTVIGQPAGNRILRRTGACEDDLIWISGIPGESAAGLAILQQGGEDLQQQFPDLCAAHLNPTAEIGLGRLLAAGNMVTSMIDTSDGLATDLAHICRQSSLGAEIFAENLPAAPQLSDLGHRLRTDHEEWMLCGGEDYHLLFTSAPDDREKLAAYVRSAIHRPIYCIGRMIKGSRVFFCKNGTQRDVTYNGFDHLA